MRFFSLVFCFLNFLFFFCFLNFLGGFLVTSSLQWVCAHKKHKKGPKKTQKQHKMDGDRACEPNQYVSSWLVGWLVGWLVVGRSVSWSSIVKLVGWSVIKSVGRSVGQSSSQLVGRSVGRSVGWSVSWSSIVKLVGWSVIRSVGWSVGRSVSWSSIRFGRLVVCQSKMFAGYSWGGLGTSLNAKTCTNEKSTQIIQLLYYIATLF